MKWKDLQVGDVIVGEETFLLIKREMTDRAGTERFTYVVLEDLEWHPTSYNERSLEFEIHPDLTVLRATKSA